MNNYRSRTNRRHKSEVIVGYSSNILGYTNKYQNYTSKEQFLQLPYSSSPPQWITFLPFISQKNIIEHKRCRTRFYNGLYTCLISVFMNNKQTIYKFCSFEFSIF